MVTSLFMILSMNSSHKLDFSEINSGPQWNDHCSSGNEHYISLSHSAVCLLHCAKCFFFLNYLSLSESYSFLLSTTIWMQLSNGAQYEVWIFRVLDWGCKFEWKWELLSVTHRLKYYYGTLLTSDLFLINFNFRWWVPIPNISFNNCSNVASFIARLAH